MTDSDRGDDTQTEQARTTFDPGQEDVSTRLIELIADFEDVPPTDLPVLHNSIDVAVLDALFSPDDRGEESPSDRTLSFQYAGYEVHIRSTGTITVSDSE